VKQRWKNNKLALVKAKRKYKKDRKEKK
jgi:hypothetical protein